MNNVLAPLGTRPIGEKRGLLEIMECLSTVYVVQERLEGTQRENS